MPSEKQSEQIVHGQTGFFISFAYKPSQNTLHCNYQYNFAAI